MAKLNDEVIKKGYKLTSINEFRNNHGQGVTSQAINYAIKNDLIDYLYIAPRVRVIVLTAKTLSYVPNKSQKRSYRSVSSM